MSPSPHHTILPFSDDQHSHSHSTAQLYDEAMRIIAAHRRALVHADPHVKLDVLLESMVREAVGDEGRGWVVRALRGAHEDYGGGGGGGGGRGEGGGGGGGGGGGEDGVVRLAQSWLANLFYPMLAIFRGEEAEPSEDASPSSRSTSSNPTLDASHSSSSPTSLRDKILKRERDRCVLTGTLDGRVGQAAIAASRPLEPDGVYDVLAAAHIVPLCFGDFEEECRVWREVRDAETTWKMFTSWTNIDIGKLVGDTSKIRQPENAVLMTAIDHGSFGRFEFYFDGDAFPSDPNTYRVPFLRRVLMGNSKPSPERGSIDVRFVSNAGIPCPDPDFLRVHAAFAKVLHLSGAARRFERLEREVESAGREEAREDALSGGFIRAKLAALAVTRG